MLISEIYNPRPLTVNKNMLIKDVMETLINIDSNASLVVDDNGELVGVISIQDISEAIIPEQFEKNTSMARGMYTKGFFHRVCNEVKNKKVKDLMRTDYLETDLSTNIMAVIAELLSNDLYVVPVVENGKLLGVVTRTEVKKAIFDGMNLED